MFAAARAVFGETELVYLSLEVAQINSWNRLNIAFRRPAGDYRPGMFKRSAARPATAAGHV